MEGLKARKRELAASLFDPDAGSTLDLTEADIEDLFIPTAAGTDSSCAGIARRRRA